MPRLVERRRRAVSFAAFIVLTSFSELIHTPLQIPMYVSSSTRSILGYYSIVTQRPCLYMLTFSDVSTTRIRFSASLLWGVYSAREGLVSSGVVDGAAGLLA